MPAGPPKNRKPSWDALYELASSQAGYLTTKQAVTAGYSRPLLYFNVRQGRLEHIGRGIYRLTHFPPSDHEDLVPIWLWSESKGIFSHETALAMHDLSDLLPSKRHITLPNAWSRRRLRAPKGVVLHFGDFKASEWSWIGPVPVATAGRSVIDCVRAHVSNEFLDQAIAQGVRRRLFTRQDLKVELKRGVPPK